MSVLVFKNVGGGVEIWYDLDAENTRCAQSYIEIVTIGICTGKFVRASFSLRPWLKAGVVKGDPQSLFTE